MSKPSVIIVGGGAFGTSTAYHLAHRGYPSITVLDRFAAPSKDAASTDLNKIIRAEYPNPLYTRLAREAMTAWKAPDGLFSGLFKQAGWIMAAKTLAKAWLEDAYQLAKKEGLEGVEYVEVAEMKRRWPMLTGDFPGWTNLWSPGSGWVPSGQALLRMAQAAEKNGVRYITGNAGYARQLLYEEDGKCVGVITADGHVHRADVVILASGASTAALIDAKEEIVAYGSAIGVIQLTPEEVSKYKDLPIIDDFEQGIMFPPDENGLIKLCSCRNMTNYRNHLAPGASLAHSAADFPDDGCPAEIEAELRAFVRDMVPELADKPWVHTRMCWDGQTPDLNFRIGALPKTQNLYLATAGSMHGFKFMPVIGAYVADMLEGKLAPEYVRLWRWKGGGRAAEEDKEGANTDPHPFPPRDLADLRGWRGRNAPAGGKLPWTWSRL